MEPIFEQKPHIPTLLDRIINVTHRLSMKLDLANSDEYIVYMNNGFWSNYTHMEIANAFIALKDDEHYDNVSEFHTNMVTQVIAILLSLERPMNHPAIHFAESFQTQLNQPTIQAKMLTHYLLNGKYPHESITDRVYYDRPLFAADSEQARYKQIRIIMDVLVVMLASYLSPTEANYQYQYMVSGIYPATNKSVTQFDKCLSNMQHRDLERLAWELSQE